MITIFNTFIIALFILLVICAPDQAASKSCYCFAAPCCSCDRLNEPNMCLTCDTPRNRECGRVKNQIPTLPSWDIPPYPMPMPNYQPWWTNNNPYKFKNLHYPGLWYQNSFDSRFYLNDQDQQRHDVMALKPNIYLQLNNENKNVDFELKLLPQSNERILAAAPDFQKDLFTWQGTLNSSNILTINNETYPYLFYDFSFSLGMVDKKQGGCQEKSKMLTLMINLLKKMNFPEIAVKDFENHWPYKIPEGFYCFSVLTEEDLEKVISIEMKANLKNISQRRILFYLEFQKSGISPVLFTQLDHIKWSDTLLIKSKKQRSINLFEWGVAFGPANNK